MCGAEIGAEGGDLVWEPIFFRFMPIIVEQRSSAAPESGGNSDRLGVLTGTSKIF
jgi:hypothetical protein